MVSWLSMAQHPTWPPPPARYGFRQPKAGCPAVGARCDGSEARGLAARWVWRRRSVSSVFTF